MRRGMIMALAAIAITRADAGPSLWQVYDHALKSAKYIDLTHTVEPHGPVWHGFGPSHFAPAADPETGQLGTQLDPPAHWDDKAGTRVR